MQDVCTVLSHSYSSLLIAPTGWGKTTLLIDLINSSEQRWIYLSPLRALCDEFYKRVELIIPSSNPRTFKDVREISPRIKLIILTPELCSDDLLFDKSVRWVLDEFHLFFFWGESFRRSLLDLYLSLNLFNRRMILLSATVSRNLQREFLSQNKSRVCLNLGNHQIKKRPRYWIKFKRSFFEDYLPLKHSILIFCRYRSQVELLALNYRGRGHSVITCLGGESQYLQQRLSRCPCPDFIIGTSAMSHGVNFPKISRVVLSYRVDSYDMWIQMVGRAGRRGECFDVHHLNGCWVKQQSFIGELMISLLCFIELKKRKLWHFMKAL